MHFLPKDPFNMGSRCEEHILNRQYAITGDCPRPGYAFIAPIFVGAFAIPENAFSIFFPVLGAIPIVFCFFWGISYKYIWNAPEIKIHIKWCRQKYVIAFFPIICILVNFRLISYIFMWLVDSYPPANGVGGSFDFWELLDIKVP